ncbi:class I SAM-dependent methyltransferase [bacterium]|nr:class I SAM-dependent methyltransferase [bacterium]
MGNTELARVLTHDVAATSLITLYCHALESQSKNPILSDSKAVELVQLINPALSKSKNKLHQKMVKGKLDKKLVVHIALRARRYDRYATDFLQKSPDGMVVNIGCGFDARFHRIDNNRVHFYDLDLPEVIQMKKNYLSENDRYHYIPSSVLDMAWMKALSRAKSQPILFLAEGIFMYLQAEAVRHLVLKLRSEFPGSELVCEVFNAIWFKKPWNTIIHLKLQREFHMGKDAVYHFGIRDSREMENWHSGIEFIDDWTYIDEPEPKIGWVRIFRHLHLFRRTQWTVHYRLR